MAAAQAIYDGRRDPRTGKVTMRGILLWLLGIPIPILILLYLFRII